MFNIGPRLKKLRKARGLTLDVLAGASGFTKGYLSRVENGKQIPALSTIQKLSNVLNCDISALLDDPERGISRNGLDVVLPGVFEPQRNGDSYSYRMLVNRYQNKYMAPFVMEIEPSWHTPVFSHDSEEFFYIISGPVDFYYGDDPEPRRLDTGASAYFDSRLKHSFRNPGKETAVLISIEYNYRRF